MNQEVQLIDKSIQPLLDHLNPADFDGKHIFITGGTGFFGLWLLSTLKALHEHKANIRATVLSRNPGKFLSKNPQWASAPWLNFIEGDVKTFSISKPRFDYLIHAATDTSSSAQADAVGIYDDITLGSRHVLSFALQAGIQRVLLTSSGAVYGGQPAGKEYLDESDDLICRPIASNSAYGEAKRAMEFLAAAYSHQYGLHTTIARCFAFVGPGLPLRTHFAIGNFVHDALHEKQISVKGDGRTVRSYLYGADLAIWLLKILVRGKNSAVYNVGSDQYFDMKQLAELVANVLAPGKAVSIEGSSRQDNSTRSIYVPSIALAAKELSLGVWTALPQAIELMGEYYRVKSSNTQ